MRAPHRVVPGIFAIMGLSYIYAAYGNVGFVEALFFGLKAAVLAIVIQAVVRVGKRALRNPIMVGLAAIAFVAIFFFGAPFPLIIVAAAVIGLVGARLGLSPMAAGTLGGLLATWVTFAPCFLWIFVGAPYIEALRGNKALAGVALGNHRRRGRRDTQPVDLVRAPYSVPADLSGPGFRLVLRCASAD